MRRTIVLGTAALAALTAISPGSRASIGVPQDFETIRYLQQISRDNLPTGPDSMKDTEAGPHVAVDPNDPNRIVAVFQQSRLGGGLARGNGFATSHDGGESWVTAPMPNLTRVTGGDARRAGDPVAAFGPDGAVYASAAIASHTFCPTGVAVQRSDDGGLTWTDPVVPQWDLDCSVLNDKDWIAVDTNPASPFFGRVYLAWVHREGDQSIYLAWSDDRGVTWTPPGAVTSEDEYAISPVLVVQPNGDLTIVFSDWIDDVIMAQTSHDGGLTFDPLAPIDSYNGVDPSDMWSGAANNRTSATVDPTTGNLYVAWEDERFRSDGLNDVVLSVSSDRGATWSPAQRVNQDRPDGLFDHLVPAIAAHSGYLHVTYVFRNNREGLNQKVAQAYTVSADGGATFGPELILGAPSDLTWAARLGNDYLALFGEYVGLAATDVRAYVVWPRATEPADIVQIYHQTMWSATIEK